MKQHLCCGFGGITAAPVLIHRGLVVWTAVYIMDICTCTFNCMRIICDEKICITRLIEYSTHHQVYKTLKQ